MARPARTLVLGIVLAGLALALSATVLPVEAVVLELVTGRRIEGTLREATASRVAIDTGGQVTVFEADEVRAIYFTSAAATNPTSPSAVITPRAGADALQAMLALRAALASGTSSREFTPRVGEASAVVERYLASAPGAAPVAGPALHDALRYYQASEFAWRNHSTASRTVWVKRDDALDRCVPYRAFVQAMQAMGEAHYSERTQKYVLVSDRVLPVLWSCAAERLAEAEQVLTTGRPE